MAKGASVKRLLAVVVLVAACGVAPVPGSAEVVTIDQVADAYLVAATTANEAMDAASPISGSSELLPAYCQDRQHIEQAFVASLDEISFPSGLRGRVETLIQLEKALIQGVAACAGAAPAAAAEVFASESLAETSRATRRAAMLLRADLDLPTSDGDPLSYFH